MQIAQKPLVLIHGEAGQLGRQIFEERLLYLCDIGKRVDNEIVQFSNHLFYEGKLKTVSGRSNHRRLHQLAPYGVFGKTNSVKEKVDFEKSYMNQKEK